MGGVTENPTRPIKQNSHAVCRAGREDQGQNGSKISLLFIQANHGRDRGLRNEIRTNAELTPIGLAFTVCSLVQG